MVANKSKGTKIELLLGKVLWNSGIRYRKNDKGIHGTPDFTLRGFRIAIFCDGEFWHGRDWEVNKEKIKSNHSFWYAKIERNIQRDREITLQLESEGWKVFRFWETDIRKHTDQLVGQVLAYIQQQQILKNKLQFTALTNGQKIPVQLKPGPQLAVVSHYLYNQEQPSAQPFEQSAKSIISNLYDVDEESTAINTLVAEPEIQYSLGSNLHTAPFLPCLDTTFTFVDLFAGIGAIRLALQQLGGRCVFCSEANPEAQSTYLLNFGEVPFGNITDEAVKSLIPITFDLLCARIPAQRITCTRKKGIEPLRNTLFYHFAEILVSKRPKAFLLETDERMLILAKGETLKTLISCLSDAISGKANGTADGMQNNSVNSSANGKANNSVNGSAQSTQGYNILEPITLEGSAIETASHKHRTFLIGFRKDIVQPDFTIAYTPAAAPEPTVKMTPQRIAQQKGLPANFILSTKPKNAFKLLRNASDVEMVRSIGKAILKALMR